MYGLCGVLNYGLHIKKVCGKPRRIGGFMIETEPRRASRLQTTRKLVRCPIPGRGRDLSRRRVQTKFEASIVFD